LVNVRKNDKGYALALLWGRLREKTISLGKRHKQKHKPRAGWYGKSWG